MNVARALVELYPAAFRDRWGAALTEEADAAGRRVWPNLAAGVVDAWMHPAIWPASSPSQRHRRTGQMAVRLGLFGWFVVHLVAEFDDRLSARDLRTWMVNGCALLIVTGVLLVTPRPRPSAAAASVVLRRAGRLLAGPVLLGLGVVVAVHHLGLGAGSPVGLKIVGLGSWWTALAWGSVQGGRIVPGLEAGLVVPPTRARLRTGLCCLGVAVASAAVALLGCALNQHTVDPLSATCAVVLLVLTGLLRGTFRDLDRVPASA